MKKVLTSLCKLRLHKYSTFNTPSNANGILKYQWNLFRTNRLYSSAPKETSRIDVINQITTLANSEKDFPLLYDLIEREGKNISIPLLNHVIVQICNHGW